MHRIRISLPKRQYARYRHLDLLHDALINAWTAAGADAAQVLGKNAAPWTFATLGGRRGNEGWVHTLVVSTSDSVLAGFLARFDPVDIRQARAVTAEMVDFSAAEIIPEPNPVPPLEGVMGVLLLSPLVISQRQGGQRVWYQQLGTFDLSAAVNARLSRIAGRRVGLHVEPDSLYLRANPKHSVLVSLKRMENGRHAFVIGMSAPLVLAGTEEDLQLAWYAGIGEKTRNGFGCLGLLERGVGR
ncbi:hypothetical protein Nhal_2922 [Nitrosococcus halophilus Nc 4]|uniref:CRISPR associated protein Cas6 C-terminal domain-containing protein n=1 Tax=Nitrosococcus halophilus (strain Nc4) TaxID=472759 RepID=D5BYJ6_NITHN|nr:CRISPR-associated endoribonuclease Cas6 [Nitrosococcus halophilus]ADE15984.1 hypothetical protein Nhal_2922 [Nitrosococcus halophilus Nc 4]